MSQTAPFIPPKPKRRRYWLWSLLVLFVVLAVWFFYPRHYRIRDLVAHLDKTEPGWRYDDLRLKVTAPTEEQNVVPWLKSMEGELPAGLSGMILLNPMQVARPVDAGTETDARYLSKNVELADENREMLQRTIKIRSQLHKLSQYPHAYFLLPTWDDAMFRNVNNGPKLEEWWTLLMLHWEEGLRSNDTKDLENRTRILWHHLIHHQIPCDLLQTSEQKLMNTILGMERALTQHPFSDEFLQELDQRLAQINFADLERRQMEYQRALQFQQVEIALDRWDVIQKQPGFIRIPWYERLYFSLVRDNYIEGGTISMEYIQARLQQHREKASESEIASAIVAKLVPFTRNTSNPEWVDALRRFKNPGLEQASFQIQHLDNIQLKIHIREAHVTLLRVALAIERSRLASGKLPASWNDVVPRYLPAIPTDPLDPNKQLQLISIKQGIKLQTTARQNISQLQFHLLDRK